METQKSSDMFAGASPKLTFWFGAIAGFAVAALIGVVLILAGGKLGLAKSSTTNTNTVAAATDPNAAPKFNDVKAVASDENIRGNKSAKLTLIEYSDLECPFCQRFHPVMKQVLDTYKDNVRWVFRQFPLSIHPNAEKEAEASECVKKIGGTDKFWSFVDKIYERTQATGTGFALTALGPLAKEVGVDQTKFQSCLDSGEMAAKIQESINDGTAGGANGTPTTLIVGKDGKTITGIPGAYSFDQVKTIVDQALSS